MLATLRVTHATIALRVHFFLSGVVLLCYSVEPTALYLPPPNKKTDFEKK